MAREKLVAALLSKTNLSREEIDQLADTDGWSLVYAVDHKNRKIRELNKLPEICFTGFGVSDKERLSHIATEAGFSVKDSVTTNLKLLVVGENAGPSKLKKAEAQNCPITDEKGFIEFLKS